jgi:hypothetical protein
VTDLNSPINSLIQEIETKFQAIKAAKESELAPKLNLAKTSTDKLQGRIQGKVDDPELNSAIAKTTKVLVIDKTIVKEEIEALKRENEALASALPDKLQQLNLPESDLSELKTAIQGWLNEINKILEELGSILDFNQTTDFILVDIKDKLTQLSPILESEGTLETLFREIKAEVKKVIEEPGLADFSKKIDDLVTEQKLIDLILELNLRIDKLIQDTRTNTSVSPSKLDLDIEMQSELGALIKELNLRIDKLIQDTRLKVTTLLPELDREVQSELGALIKLVGMAQVELEKTQVQKVQIQKAQVQEDPSNVKHDIWKQITQFIYPDKKESNSNRVAQVKAIVEYLEIAIDSLTGKPNLLLAQKLRYASKTRLRKIKGVSWADPRNYADDFFHGIKTPTKVLLGVISAFPINWFIIYGMHINWPILVNFTSPVQDVLKALPLPEVPRANQAYNQEKVFIPIISSSQNKNQDTLNFMIALLMTGTLGGGLSILIRIKDFDSPSAQKYEDDFLPFFIGLIKPILGAGFAFFIFLLLNSSISPISLKDKGTSDYYYGLLALAFIGGFSERFVPDLITQTTNNLTANDSNKPSVQGLPGTGLTIDPPTALLNYGKTQLFTLSNASLSGDDYDITLSPVIGTYIKNLTPAFVYVAPTTKGDGVTQSTVTIIVKTKTNPIQSAIATVTLI